MYLNGPDQGEDHVVGSKHQKTKRRVRRSEESMRIHALEDRWGILDGPGPEQRIRRHVLDRLRESGRVE